MLVCDGINITQTYQCFVQVAYPSSRWSTGIGWNQWYWKINCLENFSRKTKAKSWKIWCMYQQEKRDSILDSCVYIFGLNVCICECDGFVGMLALCPLTASDLLHTGPIVEGYCWQRLSCKLSVSFKRDEGTNFNCNSQKRRIRGRFLSWSHT